MKLNITLYKVKVNFRSTNSNPLKYAADEMYSVWLEPWRQTKALHTSTYLFNEGTLLASYSQNCYRDVRSLQCVPPVIDTYTVLTYKLMEPSIARIIIIEIFLRIQIFYLKF